MCFEGRHLLWFIFCTVPQIILYVFGFPAIGLYAVVREAEVGAKAEQALVVSVHTPSCHATAAPYSCFLNQSIQVWHAVQLLLSTALVLDAIIGLRKAFVAFLTSYISLPELEIHYIIVVLVLYIVLNEYGKPYSKADGVNSKTGDSLQRLDTLSLLVC